MSVVTVSLPDGAQGSPTASSATTDVGAVVVPGSVGGGPAPLVSGAMVAELFCVVLVVISASAVARATVVLCSVVVAGAVAASFVVGVAEAVGVTVADDGSGLLSSLGDVSSSGDAETERVPTSIMAMEITVKTAPVACTMDRRR